jgi:hypothetical protein
MVTGLGFGCGNVLTPGRKFVGHGVAPVKTGWSHCWEAHHRPTNALVKRLGRKIWLLIEC